MFEDLKMNLKQEKKIITDMKSVAIGFQSDSVNRDFYSSSLTALAEQLDLLNSAVPGLLGDWLPPVEKKIEKPVKKKIEKRVISSVSNVFKASKVPETTKPKKFKKLVEPDSNYLSKKKKFIETNPVKKEIIKVSYVSPSSKEKMLVSINKKDRREFLKKLKFSEDALSNIKKIKAAKIKAGIRKPNAYISFSSKYFREYSDKMTPQMGDIAKDLKSANISVLLSSYLSMAMMSSVLAFGFGLLMFFMLLIFSLSNWIFFMLPFGFMGLTLAGFYFYPSTEAGGVQKDINYELPFSTIHMAAIAGSNITPVKIFKIISMSKEYPNMGAEMRKVIVQIEIYGYDMVTSLKNVAKSTSNKKLSELFSGLATNISSGGALKNYLEKKSQSFLTDYRIERQEYSDLAGTFMDVYISILIAAPLILMMMFIVMNVAGLGMGGLSITALMGLTIVGLVIVNIIFIVVLNMKQPKV